MIRDLVLMFESFNFYVRLKAVLTHLVFSGILFAFVMYWILAKWYPMPHFQISGGWQGTKIMVIVDLVIGPLLTFLLFNPSKPRKELIFDVSIIVVIQLGLLIYGIDKVYSQRPVVQVISHRGYIAASREEDLIYQKGVNPKTLIQALNVNNITPPMLYSVYENYYKPRQLFENLFSTKIDEKQKGDLNPEMIVSRFRPVNSPEAQSDVANAAEKAMQRFKVEPKNHSAIDKYLIERPGDYYFFPLRGRYGDAIMVLDKVTQKPVDYFNIELFEE